MRLELDRLGNVIVAVDSETLDPARWWPHPGRDYVTCSVNTKAISSKSIYRFHKTTARRPYDDRRDDARGGRRGAAGQRAGGGDRSHEAQRGPLYGGAWITPPLASGCLPGVLRQVLIDEGELTEEVVMVDDVRSADGLALLSSVYGWQSGTTRRRVASLVMPTPTTT